MNSTHRTLRPSKSKKLAALFELLHGDAAEIAEMTDAEVTATLAALEISTDSGWASLRRTLTLAAGKARLAKARASRIGANRKHRARSAEQDARHALIEQIRGLISLSGNAAVFARNWRSAPVRDLQALRDELAKTAACAARNRPNTTM